MSYMLSKLGRSCNEVLQEKPLKIKTLKIFNSFVLKFLYLSKKTHEQNVYHQIRWSFYFNQHYQAYVTRIYEKRALFNDLNFVLHAISRISFLKFEKFSVLFLSVFNLILSPFFKFWMFFPLTRRSFEAFYSNSPAGSIISIKFIIYL